MLCLPINQMVSGHGEVWSARLMTALLNSRGHNFHFLDARKVTSPLLAASVVPRHLPMPLSLSPSLTLVV
jgi:aspartokinase